MRKLSLLLLMGIFASNVTAMQTHRNKSWVHSILSLPIFYPAAFSLAGIGYCLYKPESVKASWHYIKEIPFPITCALLTATSCLLIDRLLHKKNYEVDIKRINAEFQNHKDKRKIVSRRTEVIITEFANQLARMESRLNRLDKTVSELDQLNNLYKDTAKAHPGLFENNMQPGWQEALQTITQN